jgi:hypothetical protein
MPSFILSFWEVIESQQLLSSCLQRLSDLTNATDASSAAFVSMKGGTASVGSNITSRSGGSTRSGSRGTCRRNSVDETQDDEVTKATKNQLVQSLQDFVLDSQRNLLSDRALDREHQERENSWTRHFDRHSSLVDEARTYRIKIAEFRCVDDKCSRRMQQFYSSELSKLEEEILQLDER